MATAEGKQLKTWMQKEGVCLYVVFVLDMVLGPVMCVYNCCFFVFFGKVLAKRFI